MLESPVWSSFSVSRDPNQDPNQLAFLPEPKITSYSQFVAVRLRLRLVAARERHR